MACAIQFQKMKGLNNNISIFYKNVLQCISYRFEESTIIDDEGRSIITINKMSTRNNRLYANRMFKVRLQSPDIENGFGNGNNFTG